MRRRRAPPDRAPCRPAVRLRILTGHGPGRIPPPWLFAGAAAFAAAELAAGLLIGRFFASGRAEALLFLAFRPALLLVAALLAARFDRRQQQ
jgi:hypothetical protein